MTAIEKYCDQLSQWGNVELKDSNSTHLKLAIGLSASSFLLLSSCTRNWNNKALKVAACGASLMLVAAAVSGMMCGISNPEPIDPNTYDF